MLWVFVDSDRALITPTQKKTLLISSLGGVLEFYDFIIYALMAGIISKQFFPTQGANLSLIFTFASFAIGYFARPVGGVLIGHFGDTLSRHRTFTSTVLVMALSTFSMALLPTYHQIGIAAPILLTLLRFLQGFSVGGEIPGAVTYITETIPEKKGFACGMIFFSLTFGAVLGSLVIALIKSTVGNAQLEQWGWRLPFVLGGLFGFVSFYCRRYLSETNVFKQASQIKVKIPAKALLLKYPKEVYWGVIIMAVPATVSTLLFLYMPAYLARVIQKSLPHYFWINTIALMFSSSGHLFMGWLSDRLDVSKMLLVLCISTLLFAYPIFYIFAYQQTWIPFALALGLIPNTLSFGLVPRVLSELFPVEVRYSGIAVCYNFAFAVFGGLSPFMAMLLIHVTGWKTSPALLMIAAGAVALWGILDRQKNYDAQRRQSARA